MSQNAVLMLVAVLILFNQLIGKSGAQESGGPIRVGIIGLDTSHAIAFTKRMNDTQRTPPEIDGKPSQACRVVVAFPQGSADIESSVSRIPSYTEEIKTLGVEIVDSIDSLIGRVDAVLLETNDGRLHLQQIIPVLKAGKPVFVDKPVGASLPEVIAIYEAARHFDTPMFSSSALRFVEPAQQAREGKLVGKVTGCTTFSPAKLEPTHADLYWYGIHGVEQLFTVMGTGCQTVSRTSNGSTDVVVGIWKDDRVGVFRGLRSGASAYGGTVFGSKGIASTGGYRGYNPLVDQIELFFRTGKSPVSPDETIEIYAFMSASDSSVQQHGQPVSLSKTIKEAKVKAAQLLKKQGID